MELSYESMGYISGNVVRSKLYAGDVVVGNFNADANGGTRGVYDHELMLLWDDEEMQDLVETLMPETGKNGDAKEFIISLLQKGRIKSK